MISTMKNNLLKKIIISLGISFFWISVWQVAAMLVDNSLFLPTPKQTLISLFEIICTFEFYKVVFFSLVRVIIALLIGISSGIVLAFICHKSSVLSMILYPFFATIKATPVATFIVLLWILVSGNNLAIIVAVLMVMPIVWQNTLDGFKSIPKDLIEVAEIFEFDHLKRFRLLIIPALSKYIYPALITSVGLAWKSEIAAEIIAYTKNSIGMYINDSKTFMLTPSVFAWTIVVICMSVTLETLTKIIVRKLQK